MTQPTGRPVPYNIDAEENVLASLMLDNERISEISVFLEPNDFYEQKNQWIYEALLTLHQQGQPAHLTTVASALERQGHLSDVGGAVALSSLQMRLSTGSYVKRDAKIVERSSVFRQIIGAAEEIAKMGYTEIDRDLDKVLTEAKAKIFAIGERYDKNRTMSIKEMAPAALERYRKAFLAANA